MTKSVIIAGSGRSGTTWVQDSLAAANNMKTLFEPLHPQGVKGAARFAYQYINKHEINDELKSFMSNVFLGEMRSVWANYRIRPDRFNIFRHGLIGPCFYLKKFYYHYKNYNSDNHDGQIVKFIRANLMLPWITANFDISAVLIIRHPCAVVSSRLKLPDADWGAKKAIDTYRNNPKIVGLIIDEFGVDILKSMSPASALACVWCIENLLPVSWASEAKYEVVAYEDLLTDKEQEWQRLVRYLGLESVPIASILELPSQQVSSEMRNENISSQYYDRWMRQLNEQAKSDISAMLQQFGCNYYSVDSGLPLPNCRNLVCSVK